ncbi:MAG: pseudouridine synthase [Crocinitomix sp.]|nr:pseudouridine synthase [Crocinitomix sp.]
MQIEILYEDDDLVVINKPNNMLVHASYYARNIKEPSLLARLKESIPVKLYPVHRLDYKTSGVIVLAKSSAGAAEIQEQFASNTIKKRYMALVRGRIKESGTVETPVKNPDTGVYKEAKTNFNALLYTEVDIPVKPYPKSRYSWVELFPQTGRMHQLRKHMNKISHPIIGDHKYGNRHHNKMFAEELGFANMFLHAAAIEFEHPVSNEVISISASKPVFWNEAFAVLNLTS